MSRRVPSGWRTTMLLLGLALTLAAPAPVRAQGCALCRDNTLAVQPSTQRAFRHAIELMTLAAGGFFAVTFLVLRRQR